MSVRNESRHRGFNSTTANHAQMIRQQHAMMLHKGVVSPYASPRKHSVTKRDAPPGAGMSDYLKETMGMMKVSRRSNSSTPGSSSSLYSSGEPVSNTYSTTTTNRNSATRKKKKQTTAAPMDAEDLAHQVFLLKKEILAHKAKETLDGTRISNLEKDLKKAYSTLKKYEANPDVANGGDSVLVGGLKSALHKAKQEIAQRDATIADMKNDMRSTDLEEARLEVSTYYHEAVRLQMVMEENASGLSSGTFGGTESYGVTPSVATLEALQEQNRILEADNQELRTDLESALNAAHKLREDLNDIGGSGSVGASVGGDSKYAKMTRDNLLKEVTKMEHLLTVLKGELEAAKKDLDKHNQSTEQGLEMVGMTSLDDIEKLKAKVRELEEENAVLKSEQGTTTEMGTEEESAYSESDTADHGRRRRAGGTRNNSRQAIKGRNAHNSSRSARHKTLTREDLAKHESTMLKSLPKGNGGDDKHVLGSSFAGTSATARKIQDKQATAQRDKREKFVEDHKEDVEAALTMLQSILRGHNARIRLAKEVTSRPIVAVVPQDGQDDNPRRGDKDNTMIPKSGSNSRWGSKQGSTTSGMKGKDTLHVGGPIHDAGTATVTTSSTLRSMPVVPKATAERLSYSMGARFTDEEDSESSTPPHASVNKRSTATTHKRPTTKNTATAAPSALKPIKQAKPVASQELDDDGSSSDSGSLASSSMAESIPEDFITDDEF